MNSYYLPIKDAGGETDGVTLQGELLAETSFDQKVNHHGGLWRRTTKLFVYRTKQGEMVLYRYWRERSSEDWSGLLTAYKNISQMLADISRLTDSSEPVIALRTALLDVE